MPAAWRARFGGRLRSRRRHAALSLRRQVRLVIEPPGEAAPNAQVAAKVKITVAEGYARKPVEPGEFDAWLNQQDWGAS